MSVYELNEDQMNELKQHYVCVLAENEGRSPYMSEFIEAPDTVSDETIYKLSGDITFVPDDFVCTAGGC